MLANRCCFWIPLLLVSLCLRQRLRVHQSQLSTPPHINNSTVHMPFSWNFSVSSRAPLTSVGHSDTHQLKGTSVALKAKHERRECDREEALEQQRGLSEELLQQPLSPAALHMCCTRRRAWLRLVQEQELVSHERSSDVDGLC